MHPIYTRLAIKVLYALEPAYQNLNTPTLIIPNPGDIYYAAKEKNDRLCMMPHSSFMGANTDPVSTAVSEILIYEGKVISSKRATEESMYYGVS